MAIPTCMDLFGVPGLWVVMATMGAVQGPLFPTSTVFLSRWLPRKTATGGDEKAWGTSLLDIGVSVGTLLTIPAANVLASTVGWRGAFRAVGLSSLSFAALWQILAAEEPGRCFFISEEELKYLEENVPKPSRQQPKGNSKEGCEDAGWLGIPVRLALHPGLWAVFIAHIAFNYGVYYLTNWSPTYYAEVLHLRPDVAKYHLMMPHLTNLVSSSVVPLLVSLVERRGFSLLASRRFFTATGFLLAGLLMLPVYQLREHSPWVSTLLFSLANASFGLTPSGFKANYLDVTERYVGVVSGYGNTLGTVASWVGPQLVAFILQQIASWDAVLFSVALANCLAALNYLRHSTVVPIERSAGEAAAAPAPAAAAKKT